MIGELLIRILAEHLEVVRYLMSDFLWFNLVRCTRSWMEMNVKYLIRARQLLSSCELVRAQKLTQNGQLFLILNHQSSVNFQIRSP